VARPAGREFRDAGELVGVRLGQERLLRVKIRRAGAWIELRQFRVADRRGKAQHQREDDAEPHGTARHWRAIEGLDLKGQPEERSGRDQRHGIHGQPG